MISGFEELHYQLQLDGIKDMMGENSFLKVHSVVGELDIIIIAENLLFLILMVIIAECFLRRPMTYDNHPIHFHPIHSHIALKTTSHY